MLDFMVKRVAIVTLLLGFLFCNEVNVLAQNPTGGKKEKTKISRFERKALKYEKNIRKIKQKGASLLEKEQVNYTKLDKLKKKIAKLSLKAQKCRYKGKSKQHIKIQERTTKKRMKKSLKRHRKYKTNARNRR